MSQIFCFHLMEREVWLPGVGQSFADGALDVTLINADHLVHITLFVGELGLLGSEVGGKAVRVEEVTALGQTSACIDVVS